MVTQCGTVALKVSVRLKPLPAGVSIEHTCHALPGNRVSITNKARSRHSTHPDYSFDEVFGPEASNQDVCSMLQEQLLHNLFHNGFNASLLAYGQTGSGKTHSMLGSPGTKEQKGIAQILLGRILAVPGVHSVRLAAFQVYKKSCHDLLAPTRSIEGACKFDEVKRANMFWAAVTEKEVQDEEQVEQLLAIVTERRTTMSTDRNALSSRSHLFIRVVVEFYSEAQHEMLAKQSNGDTTAAQGSPSPTQQQPHRPASRRAAYAPVLMLVDLAGSERSSKTQHISAGGQAQTNAINGALSSLRRVIGSLRENEKPSWRDDPLTKALKGFLGGDAVTHVLCTVSCEPSQVVESQSTLAFGEDIRVVHSKPTAQRVATLQGSEADRERVLRQAAEAKLQKCEEARQRLERDMDVIHSQLRKQASSASAGELSGLDTVSALRARLHQLQSQVQALQASLHSRELQYERQVAALTAGHEASEEELRAQLKGLIAERDVLQEQLPQLQDASAQLAGLSTQLAVLQSDHQQQAQLHAATLLELQAVRDQLQAARQQQQQQQQQQLEEVEAIGARQSLLAGDSSSQLCELPAQMSADLQAKMAVEERCESLQAKVAQQSDELASAKELMARQQMELERLTAERQDSVGNEGSRQVEMLCMQLQQELAEARATQQQQEQQLVEARAAQQQQEQQLAEARAPQQQEEQQLAAAMAAQQQQEQQLVEARAAQQQQEQQLAEARATQQQQEQHLAEARAAQQQEQEQQLAAAMAAQQQQEQQLVEARATQQQQEQQLAEARATQQQQEQQLAEARAAQQQQEQQLAAAMAAQQQQEQQLAEARATQQQQEQQLAEARAAQQQQEQQLAEARAAQQQQEQQLVEARATQQQEAAANSRQLLLVQELLSTDIQKLQADNAELMQSAVQSGQRLQLVHEELEAKESALQHALSISACTPQLQQQLSTTQAHLSTTQDRCAQLQEEQTLLHQFIRHEKAAALAVRKEGHQLLAAAAAKERSLASAFQTVRVGLRQLMTQQQRSKDGQQWQEELVAAQYSQMLRLLSTLASGCSLGEAPADVPAPATTYSRLTINTSTCTWAGPDLVSPALSIALSPMAATPSADPQPLLHCNKVPGRGAGAHSSSLTNPTWAADTPRPLRSSCTALSTSDTPRGTLARVQSTSQHELPVPVEPPSASSAVHRERTHWQAVHSQSLGVSPSLVSPGGPMAYVGASTAEQMGLRCGSQLLALQLSPKDGLPKPVTMLGLLPGHSQAVCGLCLANDSGNAVQLYVLSEEEQARARDVKLSCLHVKDAVGPWAGQLSLRELASFLSAGGAVMLGPAVTSRKTWVQLCPVEASVFLLEQTGEMGTFCRTTHSSSSKCKTAAGVVTVTGAGAELRPLMACDFEAVAEQQLACQELLEQWLPQRCSQMLPVSKKLQASPFALEGGLPPPTLSEATWVSPPNPAASEPLPEGDPLGSRLAVARSCGVPPLRLAGVGDPSCGPATGRTPASEAGALPRQVASARPAHPLKGGQPGGDVMRQSGPLKHILSLGRNMGRIAAKLGGGKNRQEGNRHKKVELSGHDDTQLDHDQEPVEVLHPRRD